MSLSLRFLLHRRTSTSLIPEGLHTPEDYGVKEVSRADTGTEKVYLTFDFGEDSLDPGSESVPTTEGYNRRIPREKTSCRVLLRHKGSSRPKDRTRPEDQRVEDGDGWCDHVVVVVRSPTPEEESKLLRGSDYGDILLC